MADLRINSLSAAQHALPTAPLRRLPSCGSGEPQDALVLGSPADSNGRSVSGAAASAGVAVPAPETPGQERSRRAADMQQRETEYVKSFPVGDDQARAAFLARYSDPSCSARSIQQQLRDFAGSRGIDLQLLTPQQARQKATPESIAPLREKLNGLVNQFFQNPDASLNPEKAAVVRAETERYLQLALETGADLTLGDLQALATLNVAHLAMQDLAACEAPVGDHGVRHLVAHNIGWCEKLCDQLQEHGVDVSAKDRLLLHQAMIVHDMGYAVEPVRQGMNREGKLEMCDGHPLLAGRFLRERTLDAQDPLHKLFTDEDLQLMHRCVMYHDVDQNLQSGITFDMTNRQDFESRRSRLESIVRLADNSHAFVDKLPELIYRHPACLKGLRLMKTAGELGDDNAVQRIRTQLIADLQQRDDLSPQDREALQLAASQIQPRELTFASNRTAGVDPQLSIAADGGVQVEFRESAVHRQVAALTGTRPFKLMGGMVKDLTGTPSQVNTREDELQVGGFQFRFLHGADRAAPTTVEQEIATHYFGDPTFTKWALQDLRLKKLEDVVQSALGLQDEAALQTAAADLLKDGGASGRPGLQQRLQELQEQRRQLLHQAMQS